MADFTKNMASDIAADNPGMDMGTAGSMRTVDWGTEDAYWRENFGARPYATADRGYEYYRPAYEYGVESARTFRSRNWEEAEPELRHGWEFSNKDKPGSSKWEDVKHAVRDAWDRVTGR